MTSNINPYMSSILSSTFIEILIACFCRFLQESNEIFEENAIFCTFDLLLFFVIEFYTC